MREKKTRSKKKTGVWTSLENVGFDVSLDLSRDRKGSWRSSREVKSVDLDGCKNRRRVGLER